MPPPRSASSSALQTRPKSQPHARRPSRLPPHALHHSFSAVSIPIPTSPPPPPSKLPPFVQLVGAGVDRVLRANKTTRKFVNDRRIQLRRDARLGPLTFFRAIIALFLILFLVLFLLLRALFGARPPSPTSPVADALHANLARVARGEEPRQFWPPDDELALSLRVPPPVATSITPEDAKAARAAAARGWHPRRRREASVRISVIAACQDRSAFLQTALPGWCAALSPEDEVVIVDWGTRAPDHVPVASVVRSLPDAVGGGAPPCHVSVISVSEPGAWVLSRAYNLAARFARGEWFLKLDCDTMLNKTFLGSVRLPRGVIVGSESPRHVMRLEEDRIFYRYFWENARTENEQHLNGVFLTRAEDFRRVNGFDERITTYGWDDSDLYARLGKDGANDGVGLKAVALDVDCVKHIQHGDGYRGANQHLVMGPTLETQVNSQSVAALPSWTKVGTVQETEYEYDMLSKDGQFAAARIVRTPQSVLEHLSKQQQTEIVGEATNRVLHDIYGFPWSVLSEINRSRGELVRSLAILGRSTHWTSGNGFIFAEVGGSVPERVLGMASSLALAMEYERPLFLAWSSGTREEPTPRITDFFDVDSSGVADEDMEVVSKKKKKGARVYQVGRWKCRSSVDVCAQSDSAFKLMSEFRTGGHSDERQAAQTVIDVLHGKVQGKRNVLLRLEGNFPLQSVDGRAKALGSLTPSLALAEHIGKIGDLSQHLGVYIGRSVRLKGVEAMVRRLEAHNGVDVKYFVSGAMREIVEQARSKLRHYEHISEAAAHVSSAGATQEIRETIRDIAELYALSNCKNMVNDGRPPSAVSEVMALMKRHGPRI